MRYIELNDEFDHISKKFNSLYQEGSVSTSRFFELEKKLKESFYQQRQEAISLSSIMASWISSAMSDYHSFFKAVRLVQYEKLYVYKPRSLYRELLIYNTVREISHKSEIFKNIFPPVIIDRDEFGFMDFINESVNVPLEVYARNSGLWLSVLYSFNFCDLHKDNWCQGSTSLVPVDLECSIVEDNIEVDKWISICGAFTNSVHNEYVKEIYNHLFGKTLKNRSAMCIIDKISTIFCNNKKVIEKCLMEGLEEGLMEITSHFSNEIARTNKALIGTENRVVYMDTFLYKSILDHAYNSSINNNKVNKSEFAWKIEYLLGLAYGALSLPYWANRDKENLYCQDVRELVNFNTPRHYFK